MPQNRGVTFDLSLYNPGVEKYTLSQGFPKSSMMEIYVCTYINTNAGTLKYSINSLRKYYISQSYKDIQIALILTHLDSHFQNSFYKYHAAHIVNLRRGGSVESSTFVQGQLLESSGLLYQRLFYLKEFCPLPFQPMQVHKQYNFPSIPFKDLSRSTVSK